MVAEIEEIFGWTLRQWALAFGRYEVKLRSIDDAIVLQERWRKNNNHDAPIEDPQTEMFGEYTDIRNLDYDSVRKLIGLVKGE